MTDHVILDILWWFFRAGMYAEWLDDFTYRVTCTPAVSVLTYEETT